MQMATTQFYIQLKQELPPSPVTAAHWAAVGSPPLQVAFPLSRFSSQSVISNSVHHIPNCVIISLLLAPIALQKWGSSSSSSFLAFSIATELLSGKMLNPFADGVFFLE